ncbi:plantaricin C family lantibiotic [Nocardiopsis sp. RSe5-2]|uniref:Plantaricin C family lantibiotic n=1 Tax=Nocardiopsis endophytica TaxID=3018445 RepID=A0ABT4U3L0_9ACTN|nr:plantaricin C family lantibiotic [Nocardiopsis endophytica]MDA2811552.1 plantaricin C family lantibiotic [Nocardiopsis endophytica]
MPRARRRASSSATRGRSARSPSNARTAAENAPSSTENDEESSMPNPNIGILAEIDDQNLRGIAFGADAAPNTISNGCTIVISAVIGNEGRVCTLTVECQDGC